MATEQPKEPGVPTPSPASPAPPAPPVPPQAVLEQYKAKLADLGNLGSRQTAMTTYYVSILSALLGILAFKDRGLSAIDPVIVIMVGAGGMLVSVLWFFGISFFRDLFRVKLKMLEQIEESMPFETFKLEYRELIQSRRDGWLRVERLVPAIFGALFLMLLIARFAH